MQKEFLEFIKKEKLFSSSEKILLTVSGGIDSVVMCHLFYKSGLKFGIAHCNFQLRGNESDGDEKFVEQLAQKYNVPFYTTRFDTNAYAEDNKVSIQMAARKLRYSWFVEVRAEQDYKCYATAHHKDDSIETFFINLIRGTGIAGLHGIFAKTGAIIRPILFATKSQIMKYAVDEKLEFREDSSNASDKYVRNKIRHHIIPMLREINPSIENTLYEEIERLRNVEEIYQKEIDNKLDKLIKDEGDYITVSKKELKKLSPLAPYLYELLALHNFNASSVKEITAALDGVSGKQFLSESHRLIIDREVLIIEEISFSENKNPMSQILVDENQQEINIENLNLIFINLHPDNPISNSSITASLDYDKLVFPLEIRKWRQGDSFYPLGMKGRKKVSDFFIDNKIPLNEKENTWLLTSEGKIIWIIGMRIDDRFKVTDKTTRIFFAELIK